MENIVTKDEVLSHLEATPKDVLNGDGANPDRGELSRELYLDRGSVGEVNLPGDWCSCLSGEFLPGSPGHVAFATPGVNEVGQWAGKVERW